MKAKKVLRARMTIRRTVALPYLLYAPAKAPAGRAPLVLFLHGAGERGRDLAAVTVHGVPRRIEDGAEFPFFTAAPQCPPGEVWDACALEALLDRLLRTLPADPARVYVTGLSMGGAGTWALANRCPQKLAALAPVCAPFQYLPPERLKTLPVWAFHGAMDNVVPVEDTLRTVRGLRRAGGTARLTVYADADHDSWTETYRNPALYDWLLRQRRGRAA